MRGVSLYATIELSAVLYSRFDGVRLAVLPCREKLDALKRGLVVEFQRGDCPLDDCPEFFAFSTVIIPPHPLTEYRELYRSRRA